MIVVRGVSDEQVIEIIESHDRWRKEKLSRHPNERLMTTEEFIRKFREIVPYGFDAISTKDAGELEALRMKYECIPVMKRQKGNNAATVRLQQGAGRITPLSREERRIRFGSTPDRTSYYSVIDLLNIRLGRWTDHIKKDEKEKQQNKS